MQYYRNDETGVFFGAGAPTNHVDRPSVYLDGDSGTLYTNRGGGTNWVVSSASSFASADLSGLPTSDPGGGQAWLNGGVLQVGP